MLAGVTSQQMIEWEEMFDRWNIGDTPHFRDDLSAGIVAATVANANRTRGKTLEPADFVPKFKRDGQMEQSPDALYANMLTYARKDKPKAQQRDRPKPPAT